MIPNVAGQYFDIWTKDELDGIIKIMQEIPTLTIQNNQCRGIDENNVEYFWFIDTVYNKIQKLFGDDIHLVFGMLLHETNPWGIHTDAYHCSKFLDRESALSILIPYSLDNDIKNLNYGYTLIFNEWTNSNDDIAKLDDKSNQTNSAVEIYQEHLTHNSLDVVKKLTVKDIYQWKLGSVIYWDSLLLHDSNNFLRYGMKSKQAIVMHTYRNK
jgi:hypothetical protein